ncbi:MAG: hypothetical protein ACO1O6_07990 [Bacteroidota bacterium]
MLKTLPLKIQSSKSNEMAGPKSETINAILNFSRSLEVKKLKSAKKIFILNN